MFRNHRLRTVLLCLGLEIVALFGAPIRPDEIEDLLRNSRQVMIHFSVREDGEDSDTTAQPELE